MTYALSKSRFLAGCQCHDLLWWQVHDPGAPELVPDSSVVHRFEQGLEVGIAARARLPDGLLIGPTERTIERRLEMTREALTRGAPRIFEACFMADEVFVAIDVLEQGPAGVSIVEVKSTTKVASEHIPDVAIQVHVLRRCGLEVVRAEIMHLNPDCRYPDLEDLFVTKDVTQAVDEFLPRVPGEIEEQLRILNGPFPAGGFGRHCLTAKECPFQTRCWPTLRPDHVLTLYRVEAAEKWRLMKKGIDSIHRLGDSDYRNLGKVAQRQVRSVRAGERLLSLQLKRALEPFCGRLAYLDFETVSLAIPVWDGCCPWAQMPVQFSCHKERRPGWPEHFSFLATDGDDCRERMAEMLLEACEGADGIVAYYAPFERNCIRSLAEAVPSLAGDLETLSGRLLDLHPVVRDYLYDPGFLGSYSLKSVLPVLVPHLGYGDLEIADGQTASERLARLLFQPATLEPHERDSLRKHLLEYCERDTRALVRLLEKIRLLAADLDQGE